MARSTILDRRIRLDLWRDGIQSQSTIQIELNLGAI